MSAIEGGGIKYFIWIDVKKLPTWGEESVKIKENNADVFYGWSLLFLRGLGDYVRKKDIKLTVMICGADVL